MADTDVVDAYSPEWADAFKAEINKSSVYKQAAAGWEGTVGSGRPRRARQELPG